MENKFNKAFYFIMTSECVMPDIVYCMPPKKKDQNEIKNMLIIEEV